MGQRYTHLKVFHFPEKIESLPKADPRVLPPIHVRIKPTNVCNQNCWYCAYKSDDLQLGQDMVMKDFIPEDKMMEIIADLKAMDVKAVTFSGGGEPFCYPYLLSAAQELVKHSIDFASLTNGSRLKGEVAEVFARHAQWVRVSIDGWDDESYAKYRSVRVGEFTKVLTNLKTFKAYGGSCYLGISLIIDHKNASHIYDLTSRLYDLGVDSIKMSPCVVSNDAQESNQYHQKIFGQVRDQIAKVKNTFDNKQLEIFDAYHEFEEKFDKPYNWCPFLQVLCVIGADLNIYSCQDKAYNLNEGLLGSIKDKSFKDFWYDGKSKFFKINPAEHCRHHCVANRKNMELLDFMNVEQDHLSFV